MLSFHRFSLQGRKQCQKFERSEEFWVMIVRTCESNVMPKSVLQQSEKDEKFFNIYLLRNHFKWELHNSHVFSSWSILIKHLHILIKHTYTLWVK